MKNCFYGILGKKVFIELGKDSKFSCLHFQPGFLDIYMYLCVCVCVYTYRDTQANSI